MKSVIAICLTDMISQKFGVNKLKLIFDDAEIPQTEREFLPTSDTPDVSMLAIIKSTCNVLGLSLDEVGNLFGEHWCKEYVKNLYEAYYKSANCAKEFLLKMDRIHTSVTQRIPNAKPPSFEYVDEAPDKLIMKYNSDRNLQPIWLGVTRGVGLIYNEKLDIKHIDDSTVEITFSK